ncbi:MAG: YDG domain-containing protein [Ferruginibacter sp.]
MRRVLVAFAMLFFYSLATGSLTAQAPVISSPLNVNGTVGAAITDYVIIATNFPTSFNASNLPAGLNFNPLTATISGTPTAAGQFHCSISANNLSGAHFQTLVFTIALGSQAITGLLTNATKTYGDAAYSPGASASSGLPVSYTSSNPSVVIVSNNKLVIVGQGTSTITASQVGNADYNAAPDISQILLVNKKKLSVTGSSIMPKFYDGSSLSGIVTVGTVTGFIGNETLKVTGNGLFKDANAQTNKIAAVTYTLADGAGGGLAANYTIANDTLQGSITPKALIVAGSEIAPKVYDGTSTSGIITIGTIAGFVGTETLLIKAIGLFLDAHAASNKTATITYTVANGTVGLSANYTLANDHLAGDITPKELTVTGTTVSPKVYDGSPVSGAVMVGKVSGLTGADTLTITATGLYPDANAGIGKPAIVTYALANGPAGQATDYTLSKKDTLQGNIFPKPLTVTGSTIAPKIYDGNLSTGAITIGAISGFIGSETLRVSASGLFADANAGSAKAASINYQLGNGNNGGLPGNYSLTSQSSTGDIRPAPLTIKVLVDTVKCSADSITFDKSNFTATGLIKNEKIASLTLSPAGSPANDPIGVGIHQHYIGANSPIGLANTSPTVFMAANYIITVDSGNLTISKTPKLILQTDSICSNTPFAVSPTNSNGNDFSAGTTYSWAAPSGTGFTGGAPGVNQSSITGILLNDSENSTVTATYRVVPKTGSCTGDSFTVVIVVKHLPAKPQITRQPATLQLCQNSSQNFSASIPSTYSNTGTPNDVLFTWTTDASLVATSSNPRPVGKNAIVRFPGTGPYQIKIVDSVLERKGCTNDTTLIIGPLGPASSTPVAIIYNGIDFVCLNNNVNAGIDGYQWGYDTKELLSVNYTSTEAPFVTAQNLTRPITDTSGRYIWVLTRSGSCLTKTYFNPPHGRPGIIQPLPVAGGASINIYPNPVSNDAIITWRYTFATDAVAITITDMAGRRIATGRLFSNITPGRAVLNVGGLAKGIYLVNIRLNNKPAAIGKFIKK